MMIIDIEIALCMDSNVEKTVTAEAIEHVVEKRHACLDSGPPDTVEVQINRNVGLFGFPRYFCRPSHGLSFVSKCRTLQALLPLGTAPKSDFHRTRMIVQTFEARELSELRRQVS